MQKQRFSIARWAPRMALCFLSLAMLAVVSLTFDGPSNLSPSYEGSGEFTMRPNQMGPFKAVRFDSDQKGRPVLGLFFESLTTRNGNLGIFKTAMQRTLCIEDLRLGVYGFDASPSGRLPDLDNSAIFKDAADSLRQEFLGFLDGSRGDAADSFQLGVDFRNLTELFVQGFRFDGFMNDAPSLQINSATARTRVGQPGLLLRGHVVISASSRAVLQCNQVLWDVKNQTFTAKGRYTLTRNGVNTTGSNICLDMNLNTIPNLTKHRKDGKESFPWYAQAQ